jgi:hypothetical protein
MIIQSQLATSTVSIARQADYCVVTVMLVNNNLQPRPPSRLVEPETAGHVATNQTQQLATGETTIFFLTERIVYF